MKQYKKPQSNNALAALIFKFNPNGTATSCEPDEIVCRIPIDKNKTVVGKVVPGFVANIITGVPYRGDIKKKVRRLVQQKLLKGGTFITNELGEFTYIEWQVLKN